MSQVFRFPQLHRSDNQLSMEQRIERAFQQGLEQGRVEGAEQGKQLAKMELHAELSQQADVNLHQALEKQSLQNQKQLDSLVKKLQQHSLLQEKQLSDSLYDLVARVCHAVLDAELTLAPAFYKQVIEQALESLQGSDRIRTIQVSAEHGAWLQQQKIEDFAGIPVSIDATLTEGEVQFDGEAQLHLLSFGQRMDEVLAEIKPAMMALHEL